MRAVVVGLAALVGCYEAPTQGESCSILCVDTCPEEMACVNGYCVGDGDSCEPEFGRVHAGNGFACGLDEQRRRWCWGANDHHQLSASDETQIVHATLIDDTRWDSLASGGDHACGIRNGELFCWGGNDRQQVTATVIGDVAEPVRIASPNALPWKYVATGYNATCGITDRLYCWGAGDNGQLGNGAVTDVAVPTAIASEITDWETVSLGRNHSCAISRTGGLHCWGYNYYGEVGNGGPLYTGTPVLTPAAISLPGATSVAVAAYSTCAVAGGQLYCWGYQYSSVLGDPALTDTCTGPRAEPALSSGLSGWTTVSASQYMSCGLRGDEVWCWGIAVGGGGLGKGVWNGNGWGRVTLGASDVSLGWNANVDEEGDTQDLDLACIIVDGKIQCWGDNRFGQLAQGGATMHPTPREIAGDHRWASLTASDVHTCGVTTGGELYCWGTMLSGQTIGKVAGTTALPCGAIPDVPCTLSVPTSVPFHPMADAVAVADEHTCALLGTTLTCWGTNGAGQLGMAGAMPPYTVPGAWTQVFSTGSSGQCAVQNGETWCWGSVLQPRLPLTHEPQLDGMSGLFINAVVGNATVGGNQRTLGCFLDKSSTLVCFGDNTLGQFGLGPPTPGVCGNLTCDFDETATTCPGDCPGTQVCTVDRCTQGTVCSTVFARCGDGVCTRGHGETCSSCGVDCGACPVQSTDRTYVAFGVGMLSNQAAACGVRPDGRVECWGRNQGGQAGLLDATTGRTVDPVYTPYELPGLSGCTAVGAGETTTCAICDGDIWCWGSNRRGTLGEGKLSAAPVTQPRKVNVALDAGDRFVAITSGSGYSCARTEQGRGFCWGFHRYGALGTGGTSANLPVDIKLAPAK